MSELNVNRQVTISEVLSLLDQGKSRKEIAEYYGIPMSVMAEKIFSHPKLKGLKAKKQYHIALIDDTVTEASESVEENAVSVSNSDTLEFGEEENTVPQSEVTFEAPTVEAEVELTIAQDVTENFTQSPNTAWE